MSRKLPVGKAEGHDPALHIEMETLRAEREERLLAEEEQTKRESRIAECHQFIGRIQASQMFARFGNVSELMWVSDVKKAGLYKDLPGVGTWEKFCNSIGYSSKHIDEQLKNLEALGATFLETVSGLRVGYRELKQLRQLTHDGAVTINGDQLCIPDESPIPIDQDHAEELQAAIERMITASNETKKRLDKLEKDFKGALKEETLSLNSQLKTQTLRVQELEKYEPAAHDETWCEEQMTEIANDTASLTKSIGCFIIDPRLDGDRAAQAQVLQHLTKAQNMLYDLRARFESAYSTGE